MKQIKPHQLKTYILPFSNYADRNTQVLSHVKEVVFFKKKDFKKQFGHFSENLLPTYQNKSGQYYLLPNYFEGLYGRLYENLTLECEKKSIIEKSIIDWSHRAIELMRLYKECDNEPYYRYYTQYNEYYKTFLDTHNVLAAELHFELYKGSILEPAFWLDIGSYTSSAQVSSASLVLSELFQTEQDLIDFERNILQHFSHTLTSGRGIITISPPKISPDSRKLAAQTFVKAFKNFPDHSLEADTLPTVLLNSLVSDHEGQALQALKCLKKYKFELIRSHLIEVYSTSDKYKLTSSIEHILKENNALPDFSLNNVFVDEKYSEETLYHKTLLLDFLSLKSRVNQDSVFAETLIAIVVKNMHKDFKKLSYMIEKDKKTLSISATTTDKNQIEHFKKNTIEKLDVAFGENFHNCAYSDNKTVKQLLADHSKASRSAYENLSKIQELFNYSLERYRLTKRLESELVVGNKKQSKSKI